MRHSATSTFGQPEACQQPPPVQVPTLSPWAMMLLTPRLAGWLGLRRRR